MGASVARGVAGGGVANRRRPVERGSEGSSIIHTPGSAQRLITDIVFISEIGRNHLISRDL